MSDYVTAPANANVLYRADNKAVENLKAIRENLGRVCKHHINRYVQVETIDGQVLAGRIANVENGILFLGVTSPPMTRQFFYPFNPYWSNEVILPLVLYELLVISLLA